MAERFQTHDAVSENQAPVAVNAASAGLNPCSQDFNDDYRAMLARQVSTVSGVELNDDQLDKFEERLNRNGYTAQDVMDGNHTSAILQALSDVSNSDTAKALEESA